MARGVITERHGLILRAEDLDGTCYFGEVLILPYFSTETLEQSRQFLSSLGGSFSAETIAAVPKALPATRFGLQSCFSFGGPIEKCAVPVAPTPLRVSYLLNPTPTAPEELSQALAEGYRTFKLKIGISPLATELALVDALLSQMPTDATLRLDANAGLSTDDARLWLAAVEGQAIEFIEQPLAVAKFDECLHLSEEFGTAIALDESVASANDLIDFHQRGWKGVFVVKPSRLGCLDSFLQWRAIHSPKLIYSSALETSVGTEIGLRIAASDKHANAAVGYGVSQWFKESALYRHPKTPILTPGSVASEDFEQLWLSL